MPIIDRIKNLFARNDDYETKILFWSERRTLLMEQCDRSYEDISGLETRKGKLLEGFKNASDENTKCRVTRQLLQLGKEVERQQELLALLDQQIDIISEYLHGLELVHISNIAELPDSDEIARDAAKVEEMLAKLQKDVELIRSVGTITNTGMSAEEKALYEELKRENSKPAELEASETTSSTSSTKTLEPMQTSTPRRVDPEAD